MYVTNSFCQVFKAVINFAFGSKDDLVEFSTKRELKNKYFISTLKTSTSDATNDAKRNVFHHLHRYIKSLNKQIVLFLRFVTEPDIMPENEIVIAFISCHPRPLRLRTSIPQLELHKKWCHINESAEKFENVLKSPENFTFSFIWHML